jgi:hypothetical protein
MFSGGSAREDRGSIVLTIETNYTEFCQISLSKAISEDCLISSFEVSTPDALSYEHSTEDHQNDDADQEQAMYNSRSQASCLVEKECDSQKGKDHHAVKADQIRCSGQDRFSQGREQERSAD